MTTAHSLRTEIAFIDGRLQDIPTLLAGLPEGVEVHVINPEADGLAQMAQLLADRSDIDGIHIIGHGSSANVELGTAQLNAATLDTYSGYLSAMGKSLSADGDLLFYGCNIAAGTEGQTFIEQLASLTGADIAASADLTGSAALGGNWALEAHVGQIEAQNFEVADYNSLLFLKQPKVYKREPGDTGTEDLFESAFLAKGNSEINVKVEANPPGVRFFLVTVDRNDSKRKFLDNQDSHTVKDNDGFDGDQRDGTLSFVYGLEVNWDTVFQGVSESQVKVKLIYNNGFGDITDEFIIDKGNTPPTVTNPTIVASQGATVMGDLGADADGNISQVTIGTSQFGTFTTNTTGASATYSFVANTKAELKGEKTETVSYSIKDAENETTTGTATVKVTYVDDAPTGSISAVNGVSKVGQQLTQVNNISDVDDGGANVNKIFQWQAYNTTSNMWEAISGATSSTFTPAAEHANKLVRVEITAGSPVQKFVSTDVRLIAPLEGTAQVSFTNLPQPITVVRLSGDTEITSNNPLPNAAITLEGAAAASTLTTKGNGAVVVAKPVNNVVVNNEGTGLTTINGVTANDTIKTQGTGPVLVETTVAITVDNTAPAGDLTVKNTGTTAVTIKPVGADAENNNEATIKLALGSTGPVVIDEPTANLKITNGGSGVVTVNSLKNASTVTSNGTGTGAITVVSPEKDLTLVNGTATSTLTVTGAATDSTVTTTGTGATAVSNPAGSVTVNNTGTGVSTVSGTLSGNTVTAKGTGSIVVNSVLSEPAAITIDVTDNQSKVAVDNDGTGAVTVNNLMQGGTLTSTGTGTGDNTIKDPTGSFTVVNTGTNTVRVEGFDDAATLTATGTGPTAVVSPDGDGTISNTGSGLVTVSGVLDGKTFETNQKGPTTFSSPVGDLTVNNTGAGTVTVSGLADEKTLSTNGTQPVVVSHPTGNLTVANNGTGLNTVTGLLADKTVTSTGTGATTVSDPAGSLTLHNTGTGLLTAAAVNSGATVTTTGTTASSISDPDGDVTVLNTGTGTATVTGTLNGKTVTANGTGPIVVNSVLLAKDEITVAAGPNTDITLDNDATGTITLTGVTTGSTIKSIGSGTGSTNIKDPTGTGTLTVENTGVNTLTITGLDSGATLTNTSNSTGAITLANPDSGTTTVDNQSSGSTVTVTGAPIGQVVNGTGPGLTNVDDPLGNVTLHNTGTGDLRASRVNNDATVTTTGSTATTIHAPDNNVTVNNTGTGVATVTGAIDKSTVTTQGTGPITVNSVLAGGNTVTVHAASNTNLTVDNDGLGAINVTGVPNASTINSIGTGQGTTTVLNPVGNLTLNNTGSNTVTVAGFDNNKVLTTPGTGPITVATPDGNMFLTQTGTGVVTVTGIKAGNSITTSGTGPVSVSEPVGNVNVVNNGTGLVTVSGMQDGSTVNSAGSGPQAVDLSSLTPPASVTIDNDGIGIVSLVNVPYGITVFFTGTGQTTVSSFSGDPGNGPVLLENLGASLVTVANDATGVDKGTIKSGGSGPIKFDTDVTTGQTLTVDISDNTNVTFDNDGQGILNVTGVPDATTLTSSSSGSMVVTKPAGSLTVVNTGTGGVLVEGAAKGAQLATASKNISVSNPEGDVTVVNTGTGTVAVTGLKDDTKLTASGTGNTTVSAADADVDFAVSNTGTGLLSVSGVADGKTLATQGTGQIVIVTALAEGQKVTIDTAENSNVRITNTGAGQVILPKGLSLDNNDTLNLSLSSANAKLELVGALSLANTPLALTLAPGYTPVVGDTITLIENDGDDAIAGIFAGKPEGASFVVGGRVFTISYKGGGEVPGQGNDVVLTMTGLAPTGGGGAPAVPPAAPADADADGVPRDIENEVPGLMQANGVSLAGDGNGDGILDADQAEVTSIPFLISSTPISNPGNALSTFITIVAGSSEGKVALGDSNPATLIEVKQIDIPANLPSEIKFPLGLLSFSANVGLGSEEGIGVNKSFSIYVDPSVGATGYFKQNAAGEWVNIASAAFGGQVVTESGRTRLDFNITDGGEFDSDGIVNGVIADPGGIGFSVSLTEDSDQDQFPDALEAANGLQVGVKDNDVFGSSKLFAMQLYRDILYREGESAGVQYWQSQIDGGLSRAQVALEFLNSSEFQAGTGAVARLYFGAFNRLPDVDGMNYWVGQQKSGLSIAQISNAFAHSDEFKSLHGNPGGVDFIQSQFQGMLGRIATLEEQSLWQQRFNTSEDRGALLFELAESSAFKQATNDKIGVALNYLGLLGRPAEQVGFDFWVNQINGGTPAVNVVGQFIDSAEYSARFLEG